MGLNLVQKYREELLITFFYFLSYWLTLANGGVYIDDVVISGWNQGLDSLLLTYKEVGWFLYWPAYLHKLMFLNGNFYGVFAERCAVFTVYLASALLLYRILLKSAIVGKQERLYISIFFAIMPVNTARIAISNLHYAICYLFFWAGLYLACGYIQKRGVWRRVLALTLFVVSFSTNSLLCFYAAALLLILYLVLKGRQGNELLWKTLSLSDFIILPVLFWVVLKVFFQPFGNYSSQNLMTLDTLRGVVDLVPHVYKYIYLVFKHSFSLASLWMVVLIVPLTYKLCRDTEAENDGLVIQRDTILAAIGLLLLILGVFPYMAVGKYPQIDSWNSRHALLLPLGLSFLFVYLSRVFIGVLKLPVTTVGVLGSLAIVCFVSLNNRTYARFEREWVKQLAISEAFKSAPIAGTFIIEDRTKTVDGHPPECYRWYFWNALMYSGTGRRNSAGFNSARYEIERMELITIGEKYKSQYFIEGYAPQNSPVYKALIDFADSEISVRKGIDQFFSMLLRNNPDKGALEGVLKLEYVRLPGNAAKLHGL